MSGVEVVGLVLGAIPLLISGLEHYADGIHTMKNMWDYDAVISHLVGEFRLAQGIFRHSCQNLLMHVLPDSEVAKLLDGASPDWDDPELDKKLRAQLGSDYQAYIHAVSDLRRRLTLFIRKLGLDEKTMLPPWISNAKMDKRIYHGFFRDTWRRIRGGFECERFEKLLGEIQTSINQIAEFTRGSVAIAPKRVALQERTNSKYWLQNRDQARRIFESLGPIWPCTCPNPHRASLRLDVSRTSTLQEGKAIKFGILFSYDVSFGEPNGTSLPWNWREVDIQPLRSTAKQTTLERTTRPLKSKHVSFDVPTGPSAADLPLSSPSVSKIDNLCQILSQSPLHTSCVGYLEGNDFQHHVYMSAHSIEIERAQEMICFYDVLRRKGAYGLGVKEKYGLALTVASAVLQLHATPWLKEKWCLDDIHFVYGGGVPHLVDRPYVTQSFVSPKSMHQSTHSSSQADSQGCACIANEAIFALGVALIEISFGVPILSLKQSSDPDIPGFTRFGIALRLVHQDVIKGRDHDKYAEVVLRCVKGVLGSNSTRTNLEETGVQQSFYDGIILPLQQLNDVLYDQTNGGTANCPYSGPEMR